MLWLCRINTSKILQRAGAFHWLMISISLTRFDIFTGLWWWSYWGQWRVQWKVHFEFLSSGGFFFFFSYNFIVNCFAVTERDLRNGEKYWLIRYLVTNLKEKQSDLALNKSNVTLHSASAWTVFILQLHMVYFTYWNWHVLCKLFVMYFLWSRCSCIDKYVNCVLHLILFKAPLEPS